MVVVVSLMSGVVSLVSGLVPACRVEDRLKKGMTLYRAPGLYRIL